MSTPIKKKLLALQKQLSISLKKELEEKLGSEKKQILKYQKEYEKDFKRPQIVFLNKEHLIEQILDSQIVFLTDFHTHSQSQKTALRLLKEIHDRAQTPWSIGLEVISSQHQNILNAFLNSEIDEQTFLKKIQYEKSWGLPWEGYEEILIWAKNNAISVIALNRPEFPLKKKELLARDKWAAQILVEHHLTEKKNIFVLYGQFHISSTHLLGWTEKIALKNQTPLLLLGLHQNHDALYWKLAPKIMTQPDLVAQINPKTICIFSITPWTQLKSLITYIDEHPDPHQETTTDPFSDVQKYAHTVCQFFNIPDPDFANLSLYWLESEKFINFFYADMNSRQAQITLNCLKNDYPVYFYEKKNATAYVKNNSLNQLAELGSIHIFYAQKKNALQNSFHFKILEFAFSFFGSLLLNPKRKCDLYLDHKNAVENLKKGCKARFRGEKKTRLAVMEFLEQDYKINPLHLNCFTLSEWMTCRYIGQILGKNLHHLILINQESLHKATQIFLGTNETEKKSIKSRFEMLCSLMQEVPIFNSKKEEF